MPSDVRAHAGLEAGTPLLLLLETADGLVLLTREQARMLLRRQLAGSDVVEQLLADRRAAAAAEDAARRWSLTRPPFWPSLPVSRVRSWWK